MMRHPNQFARTEAEAHNAPQPARQLSQAETQRLGELVRSEGMKVLKPYIWTLGALFLLGLAVSYL